MSEHHKDSSVAVAQTLFDGMTPAEQAEVQAEADNRGVSAIEVVRMSLDILIAESQPTSPKRRIARSSGQ